MLMHLAGFNLSYNKGRQETMKPIKRALISVWDKTGVVEFAKELVGFGVEIISTGKTAKALREARIKTIPIQEVTGNPEAFDGRMKTISFKVGAGILYNREKPEDVKEAKELGIKPIDMVVNNLYPFEETIAKPGVSVEEALENIDIGGPTMIRAAAKNLIVVVIDPKDYPKIIQDLKDFGQVPLDRRTYLAAKVFKRMANYDSAIDKFMAEKFLNERVLRLSFRGGKILRYGENPHQKGEFYPDERITNPLAISNFKQLQGKALSFNNYLDIDGALYAISQLGGVSPACVVIKHTNPCGAAINSISIWKAYEKAWQGDPLAAFGSIIAVNRIIYKGMAQKMLDGRFFEVLLAPEVDEKALEVFSQKPNLRILVNPALKNPKPSTQMDIKRVRGGILKQDADTYEVTEKDLKVVTETEPTEDQIQDLLFAWKVCKASKSNTIVLAKDKMLVGSGVGQQSRVKCCKLAVSNARHRTRDAVAASDAFFPFPDGPEVLIKAGVKAIIQPGGSLKDQLTIDFCNKHKITMVFCGVRCFRH